MKDDTLDWSVRLFIYNFIVNHERPPTIVETAMALNISHQQTQLVYQRLNQRHALFLEPDSDIIRMAHPFSGVPTPFSVQANGHTYWANCAWDAFGIPAALSAEAKINAVCADTQELIILTVKDDQVYGHGEVVHFLLPFRHWYDNLIFT